MIILTILWQQLALYYPPEDNIVSIYILDEKFNTDQEKQLNDSKD
jgi:hypothetical protein